MIAEWEREGHGWDVDYGPDIYNAKIPGTIDLGFYYDEVKDQVQVAEVPVEDRATHLYVAGATGTGKTKFLEFLIRQDISNGQGFGVIDPHGDLIEEIKGYLAVHYCAYVDEDLIKKRTVLIDPTDPYYTVTFNPLEAIPGVSVAEQAGELVSSFRKIWADSWGSRMEDLMRNSLIALGESGLTLCELTPFLTRRGFRQVVLERVQNPTSLDYFRRFDILTDRAQVTWIEPVMNKINAFMADDRMRQMFASPTSSFSFREIMDERKHLLIKLDKGKLKGAADLLGSLFMAKLQMTAFSRSDVPPSQRVPFCLYIDEFQNFASESFEVILSEARKYGLSLVMAHQSLSQIPDDLRGLILSSAGLQVFFRVNRSDANILSKEAFSYSGYEVKSQGVARPNYWSYAEEWEHRTADLQNLAPRECFVKHKIQGGCLQLHTVGIQPSWEALEMDEEEYMDFLSILQFGDDYLLSREDLIREASERQWMIEQMAKAKTPELPPEKAIAAPCVPIPEALEVEPVAIEHVRQIRPSAEEIVVIPNDVALQSMPEADTKVEREHRRLQHLIKRLAQDAGYLATLEQSTADGQGRVDVGLESDNRKIACEICVTTPPEHELANIRKCLASEYDLIILCSPDRKSLEKVKVLSSDELTQSELARVRFFEPDALTFFFEEEAAKSAGKTKKVKGYKVKLNFQPQQDVEKKSKRQAVAQIVLQSFRHDKPSQ